LRPRPSGTNLDTAVPLASVMPVSRNAGQSSSPQRKGDKHPAAPVPAPAVTKDGGDSRRSPWLRRAAFAAAIAAALGLLESAAWVHDAKAHFRFQLLKALDMLHTEPTPLAAQPDAALKWPAGVVFVRDPQDNPPPAEPYVVGGRVIPGAQPSPRQALLEASRSPPQKRVFILGESAAFGYPLSYEHSFGAHLEQALKPDNYQVLNAAEPGFYSGLLVPIARRIVDCFKPEVLILYLGNNEWIHWRPADEAPNPAIPRIARFLANSRALAYLEYLGARRMAMRSHGPAAFSQQHELTGLEYAFSHPMSKPLPGWQQLKGSFLANFERNLLDMINHAKASHVRVILMTVPFSYKLSPAWMHPQPLASSPANWQFVQQNLDRAAAAYQKGDHAAALEILDQTLAREPSAPVLHYLRALALEASGKPAEAEQSYALCREKMIGHLGSLPSINQIIRQVAATTQSELVDLQALFDDYEHSTGHYFNDSLILDDCHPTPLGHALIARSLAPLLLPAK
jgi:lysophospholipase L1-like esterase